MRAWWKKILNIFISVFTFAALEGIIGNRADTLLTLGWSFIQETGTTNLWLWYILLIVLLVYTFICMHFLKKCQISEHTLVPYHKMLKLDDLLLLGLWS